MKSSLETGSNPTTSSARVPDEEVDLTALKSHSLRLTPRPGFGHLTQSDVMMHCDG